MPVTLAGKTIPIERNILGTIKQAALIRGHLGGDKDPKEATNQVTSRHGGHPPPPGQPPPSPRGRRRTPHRFLTVFCRTRQTFAFRSFSRRSSMSSVRSSKKGLQR